MNNARGELQVPERQQCGYCLKALQRNAVYRLRMIFSENRFTLFRIMPNPSSD